jgi:hypothetical protein
VLWLHGSWHKTAIARGRKWLNCARISKELYERRTFHFWQRISLSNQSASRRGRVATISVTWSPTGRAACGSFGTPWWSECSGRRRPHSSPSSVRFAKTGNHLQLRFRRLPWELVFLSRWNLVLRVSLSRADVEELWSRSRDLLDVDVNRYPGKYSALGAITGGAVADRFGYESVNVFAAAGAFLSLLCVLPLRNARRQVKNSQPRTEFVSLF